jgi:hypothetical protein
MTKEEAMVILAILKSAYPNSYRNVTVEDASGIATIWAAQFVNIPAKVVMIAINKWISTQPFPPSISELKKKITGLYWEAWEVLEAHKRHKHLTNEQVAEFQLILDVSSALRGKITLEPSLLEVTSNLNNHLLISDK